MREESKEQEFECPQCHQPLYYRVDIGETLPCPVCGWNHRDLAPEDVPEEWKVSII